MVVNTLSAAADTFCMDVYTISVVAESSCIVVNTISAAANNFCMEVYTISIAANTSCIVADTISAVVYTFYTGIGISNPVFLTLTISGKN